MTGEMWQFVAITIVLALVVVGCYRFLYVPRRTRDEREGGRRGEEHLQQEISLPEGYWLEEEEPDFLILHRPDGSSVGVFAFPDASPQTIRQAAERDVRERGG